jgi:hypothetical protein
MGSSGAAALASASTSQAIAEGGRPWRPTGAISSTRSGCWAPNPAGRRPAGAATGTPPEPPWSTWPAGAATAATGTTATSGLPTAIGSAAPGGRDLGHQERDSR